MGIQMKLSDFPRSRVYVLQATHETGRTLRVVRTDVNAALKSAQLMIDCGYHVHVEIEHTSPAQS